MYDGISGESVDSPTTTTAGSSLLANAVSSSLRSAQFFRPGLPPCSTPLDRKPSTASSWPRICSSLVYSVNSRHWPSCCASRATPVPVPMTVFTVTKNCTPVTRPAGSRGTLLGLRAAVETSRLTLCSRKPSRDSALPSRNFWIDPGDCAVRKDHVNAR